MTFRVPKLVTIAPILVVLVGYVSLSAVWLATFDAVSANAIAEKTVTNASVACTR